MRFSATHSFDRGPGQAPACRPGVPSPNPDWSGPVKVQTNHPLSNPESPPWAPNPEPPNS